jgi:release factor glutamine methyltransferase
MRRRAARLAARGLLGPGQRHEDLVVVRADLIAARTGPVDGGEGHAREHQPA